MSRNKKYHFVYQTKNLINGKTYIGTHSTNKIDDNYIGCGIYRQSDAKREVKRDGENKHKYSFKGAVIKHGYENFKREILCFFDSAEEAYEEESWLVDEKWVKDKSNYNISLGGKIVHIMEGKDSPQYKGDIYVINKVTGEILGVYNTATQIKRTLGLNQSLISSTLRYKSSGIRDLFFTRNPEIWKEELNFIFETFKKNKENIVYKMIYAYNLDGTLYKEFKSMREACRYFGKGKYGACYLDDVIDKFRKRDGKPLKAWGYVWKSKEVNFDN